MPADAAGDIVRVSVYALYPDGVGGQQVEQCDTSHLCTAAGGGDTRQALASSVLGLYFAALGFAMATSSKIYGAKTSSFNKHPPPLAATFVLNAPGSGGPNQLPTQVRGLIRWTTAIGGRTGRGRIYVWTPDESHSDVAGNPDAPFIGAMGTLATALIAPQTILGTTWRLCIAHRDGGGPGVYTADVVTGKSVFDGWATQRRSGETGRINVTPF